MFSACRLGAVFHVEHVLSVRACAGASRLRPNGCDRCLEVAARDLSSPPDQTEGVGRSRFKTRVHRCRNSSVDPKRTHRHAHPLSRSGRSLPAPRRAPTRPDAGRAQRTRRHRAGKPPFSNATQPSLDAHEASAMRNGIAGEPPPEPKSSHWNGSIGKSELLRSGSKISRSSVDCGMPGQAEGR